MHRFFRKCLQTPFLRDEKSQRRGKVSPARRVRPCLETLEDRVVPSGANWSEYNYNASGTRDNTAEHRLSPSNVSNLQVKWEFPTQGVVAGTPAVVDNTVYAGDSMGNFYAVSRNGKLLWETKVNGPVTDSPLVVNNTVIFGTLGDNTADVPGTIYGLDARTGKVLWQTQPQPNDPRAQIWGSATLVGKNVAIGVASGDEGSPLPPTSRGSLVLLDPHNGHIIWQTYTISNADYAKGATGSAIWSTPAYDAKLHLIYAGTGNNYSQPTTGTSDAMMAFNAKTGAIVWVNQRTSGDDWDFLFNSSAPDFDFGDSPHIYKLPNGETVVGSGQKSGFYWVFDAKTGTLVNIQANGKQGIQVVPGSTLGGLFATAAVDPKTDVVYANARVPTNGNNPFPATGELAAISGNGLKVLWDVPTPSADQSGVALANGVVYFQDTGGTFYAVDARTGKVLAQLFTGGGDSGPAVSGGQIFLGQGKILAHGIDSPGGIVALGLSKPERNAYSQTNLVSDIPGEAQITDPNLKNPWGVSESATSPFWVSDQGTNDATIYSVTASGVTKVPLTVAIPTNKSFAQGPTGQVYNATASFDLANGKPAAFIFANLNGSISAWNFGSGTTAQVEATTSGALYTGLAIGSNAQGNFLYAVNNAKGTIDVFNSSFAPVTLGTGGFGTFTDPLLPSDLKLAPFNVQNINGELYVTYAPVGHPAQTSATPGEGAVAIFDTSGHFLRQLAVGGQLASPWGMAMAPTTFGKFGGDLLVGNFAYNYSEINAFDPTTGKFLGTLTGANGKPILNPGLWTLTFGNGGNGGNPNTLYFTAGINGEKDGLFGSIQAVSSHPHHPHHHGDGQDHHDDAAVMPSSTTSFSTAPSPSDPLIQRIDAIFQEFDAALLALESRLGAIDPQLSRFFLMFNGNLKALEAHVLSEL
ncbi:MAG: TIGR03118 family protein [Gemmataceae bacterium]